MNGKVMKREFRGQRSTEAIVQHVRDLLKDPIQQVTEEEEIMRENRERRLPPIKEFQRDYRAGKASTRIRCLMIVNFIY